MGLRDEKLAALTAGLTEEGWEAFRAYRNNARRRGVAFEFSALDWWAWWQTDNRWASRCVGHGKLVIARNGDVGAYHPNNAYCTTHEQNIKDVEWETWSLAHRQAYADGKETWLKGRRGKEHPKSHAVVTPLGRFGSMALAAEAHGMSRQAVHAAIKNGRPGWTRLDNLVAAEAA